MKVRLNKNEPNAAQRKVLKQECVREFDKLLESFNHDTCVQVLYYFRFKKGYGKKRLEELAEGLTESLKNIKARYELSESDTTWICEKHLKDSGIDVDAILK
jgi:hypothetical protein